MREQGSTECVIRNVKTKWLGSQQSFAHRRGLIAAILKHKTETRQQKNNRSNGSGRAAAFDDAVAAAVFVSLFFVFSFFLFAMPNRQRVIGDAATR